MDPETAEQLRATLAAETERVQVLEAELAQLRVAVAAAAAPTTEEQPVQVKIEVATPPNPTMATGSGTPRAPARDALPRVLPFVEPLTRDVADPVQQSRNKQMMTKAVKPERFGGSAKEVLNWLDTMESYLDALGMTESPEGVATAVTYLHGAARTWWRALPGTKEEKKKISWEDFSKRLLKQFQAYNIVKDARTEKAEDDGADNLGEGLH